MNNELKQFLDGSDEVPSHLYSQTLKAATLTLKPIKMLVKFYLVNFLGAILTIAICPQYGLGPIGGELGLVKAIMNLGPVLCGVFCATIFFGSGNLLSFLFLDKMEQDWIGRHKFSVIIPYISFIFMLGMGARSWFDGHIHHDGVLYYASWILTGLLLSITFYKAIQSRKFFNQLGAH